MTVIPSWLDAATHILFDWILYLPRDLAIGVVALLMALGVALARKYLADQEWLRRAAADRQRQRQLRREAQQRKDPEAVLRHESVLLRLKRKTTRATLLPLLLALVPVGLLAIWSFRHLAWHPVRPQETLELRVQLPPDAVGEIIHLAPEPGLVAINGWIQRVESELPAPPPERAWDRAEVWVRVQGRSIRQFLTEGPPQTAPPPGVAVWNIMPLDRTPHLLRVRYGGRTYEVPFHAGALHPGEPIHRFPDSPISAVTLAYRPVYLFDRIGGLSTCHVPAWLLACLFLTPPLVRFLRKILRIA
jgi:hypothetical protein